MRPFDERLHEAVAEYRRLVAGASDDLSLLLEAMARGDRLDDRATMPGHVTTSAIVVTPARDRVLLIHHRKLLRWLQPGGHWESADAFWQSAQREAREETGIEAALHPWHGGRDLPLDIDTHWIPPRANGEPGHWHHDLRFALVADAGQDLAADAQETLGAAWRPFSDLEAICPRSFVRLGSAAMS